MRPGEVHRGSDARGHRRRHGAGFTLRRLELHQEVVAGSAAIDALLVWVAQRRAGEKNVVLESE